ncbi:unnamed protein product [Blepharisma stoltei]|uniref:Uncharacterized protein n=1 Tax=Blepharisma stoltei TaxID=1481888 RepID=A0AAU9IS67_9CILI|nr:unnamed protein product [Blepharisma stoltei]
MTGCLKGDPHQTIETFQNKVTTLRLLIEEKQRDFVLEGFDTDLSQFILTLKTKVDSLRMKVPEEITQIKSNEIFVIVPMGIPAMGKSFIRALFQAAIESHEGVTFSTISSGKIREKCIQEYMESSKIRDWDYAYQQTNWISRVNFAKSLSREMKTKSKCHVLFLDKNFPPNSIPGTFAEITKNALKTSQIRIIALVPECGTPFVINDDKRHRSFTYELSLPFLIQCLVRARNRVDHETLTGSLTKKVAIVLMMYNMYRNVRFDDFLTNGFDYIMRLPFTEENAFEVDDNMRLVVSKTLTAFRPGGLPNEHTIRDLVELIDQYAEILPNIDPTPKISSELSKLFDLGISGNSGLEEETKEPIRRKDEIISFEGKSIESEEEIQQNCKKGRPDLKNYKLPIYIGIDADAWFRPLLIPIVISCLREFADAYEHEDIVKDLQEIQNAAVLEYFSEVWTIVGGLHVTTFFLGGNNELEMSEEYREFAENKEINFVLTHIVYVPGHIICASADKFNPYIKIANKHPHMTLLTGKWTAKYSTDVLSSIPLESGINRYQISLKQGQLEAYSISLSSKIMVRGIAKTFFN